MVRQNEIILRQCYACQIETGCYEHVSDKEWLHSRQCHAIYMHVQLITGVRSRGGTVPIPQQRGTATGQRNRQSHCHS